MPKGKKAGRVRDKWRDKKWVLVNPPSGFKGGPIAYIPVTDEEKAVGRVIENTLFDFEKQDPQQHTIKIYSQIEKIQDGVAFTRFKGHEYAKEFLRSLIRRGTSLINFVNDYTTADGYKFRVSVIAFTQRRLNTSKKQAIRHMVDEVLGAEIPKLTVEQFVQAATYRKFDADIHAQVKKVAGVRHIGIKKTKMLSSPKAEVMKQLPVEATQQ